MARTKGSPAGSRTERLVALFGDTAATARAVLDMMESEPAREWLADELIDATGFRSMEVMVVLARLTAAGMVDHHGMGGGHRCTDGARD